MREPLKQALRTTYQKRRKALPLDFQKTASQTISQRIQALDQYHHAEHIAFYHSVSGEIDLSELWHLTLQAGKKCYFPALNPDRTLSFLPATRDTVFVRNQYGIPEPQAEHATAIAPETLSMILLPLVAFDTFGTRLGMGGGYFDKTLAHIHTSLFIGIAYEFQRRPFITPDPWDIPLHLVVTEQNVHWFQTPKQT